MDTERVTEIFGILFRISLIKGRGNPLRWPRNTLYPLKLAPTSPTSGDRSVGRVRLGTQATDFVFCLLFRIRGEGAGLNLGQEFDYPEAFLFFLIEFY
jgi:hypothetical protein